MTETLDIEFMFSINMDALRMLASDDEIAEVPQNILNAIHGFFEEEIRQFDAEVTLHRVSEGLRGVPDEEDEAEA